ncbi:sensor histidine kinase [Companilactobacillus mishanensis]|uniref:histidine kinase n=1 Tax=Companilactobacillus mishanensis TaxID=2486008 RepID=A0ABW9P7B4_9LACO|nr:HAMP domain-containing sensor histidine kinase [Companilactobacillus mishanensis]MQS45118.1 HAMP domain-containing histidine kinase [Companilactobacillus mishanensis]
MNKRIKLNNKEKGVLLLEGIGTFLLFQLINVILVITSNVFFGNNQRTNFFRLIQTDSSRAGFWQVWFFFCLVLVLEIFISFHVVMKTFRQFEVEKVERELAKIADGDLNQQLHLEVNPRLQGIVNSINSLISNTNNHIAEQRRSEKSKDELITNVSHDIRTPLTSIIGYLGLIESKNYEDLDQILKYTHVAYKKSLEMQNLVNDLFEYTNVQHANSTLSMTKFDMAQMLDQLSADFELEANKRGMEIVVNTSPEKILMTGDTDKLGRVFNNLIMNAFKYGDGATHLWLEAKQTPQEVVVRVANNGKPIPKESLDHLFDRFYRVEDSRSKETGGTGLGLAIAQSMVKMHGGQISVESNNDRTAFIIHFPTIKQKNSEE